MHALLSFIISWHRGYSLRLFPTLICLLKCVEIAETKIKYS